MAEKTKWEACRKCGTYITKEVYNSQNGLCTVCRVKELFGNLLGGKK